MMQDINQLSYLRCIGCNDYSKITIVERAKGIMARFFITMLLVFFTTPCLADIYADVYPESGEPGDMVTITGTCTIDGVGTQTPVWIDFGSCTTIAATASDETGSFTASFTIPSSPEGTNTIMIRSEKCGSITLNFLVIIPAPLLLFSKEIVPNEPVSSGATLTYTLIFENIGSDTATNILITDAIPAGTIYITDSVLGTNTTISYSHDGGLSYDGLQAEPVTHIRWMVVGELGLRDIGNVGFQVRVE